MKTWTSPPMNLPSCRGTLRQARPTGTHGSAPSIRRWWCASTALGPCRLLTVLAAIVASPPSPGSAADPADPPSVRIRREASGVHVSWTAQPNRRYRVETAPDITGGWASVAEMSLTSSEGSWTDPDAVTPLPRRFYRVLDQGPAPAEGLDEDAAFRAADLVPQELSDLYDRSAQGTLDAIEAATSFAPSGSPPVTNGTLRLTGLAANPVLYDPTPDDRLVVVPLQGPTLELFILQADLIRGISEWRHVSEGIDLVFRRELAPEATLARARGQYRTPTIPGVVFTVDLAATITGFSEVDSSGTHTLTDATTSGPITAPGFAQTVLTRNRFELVSARGPSGKLQTASTSELWNNNTVVLGDDSYVWVNVKKQRSFWNGQESDVDTYWAATGQITRNGEVFGQYRKTLAPVGVSVIDVRFQLVLADRVIDVERWTVPVP